MRVEAIVSAALKRRPRLARAIVMSLMRGDVTESLHMWPSSTSMQPGCGRSGACGHQPTRSPVHPQSRWCRGHRELPAIDSRCFGGRVRSGKDSHACHRVGSALRGVSVVSAPYPAPRRDLVEMDQAPFSGCRSDHPFARCCRGPQIPVHRTGPSPAAGRPVGRAPDLSRRLLCAFAS